MLTILSDYEARIDRLLGDGLMAIFGAPQVREDDAERAIRAALDIQAAALRPGERGGLLAGGDEHPAR